MQPNNRLGYGADFDLLIGTEITQKPHAPLNTATWKLCHTEVLC